MIGWIIVIFALLACLTLAAANPGAAIALAAGAIVGKLIAQAVNKW